MISPDLKDIAHTLVLFQTTVKADDMIWYDLYDYLQKQPSEEESGASFLPNNPPVYLHTGTKEALPGINR